MYVRTCLQGVRSKRMRASGRRRALRARATHLAPHKDSARVPHPDRRAYRRPPGNAAGTRVCPGGRVWRCERRPRLACGRVCDSLPLCGPANHPARRCGVRLARPGRVGGRRRCQGPRCKDEGADKRAGRRRCAEIRRGGRVRTLHTARAAPRAAPHLTRTLVRMAAHSLVRRSAAVSWQ